MNFSLFINDNAGNSVASFGAQTFELLTEKYGAWERSNSRGA